MATGKLKAKMLKVNYGMLSLLCLTSAITSTGITVYSASTGITSNSSMNNVYDKLQSMITSSDDFQKTASSGKGSTEVNFSLEGQENTETKIKDTIEEVKSEVKSNGKLFTSETWPKDLEITPNTVKENNFKVDTNSTTKPNTITKPNNLENDKINDLFVFKFPDNTVDASMSNPAENKDSALTKPNATSKPNVKPNNSSQYKEPEVLKPIESNNDSQNVTKPNTNTIPPGANTTDEYIETEKPAMTFEEALSSLGINNINLDFKLNSKSDIKSSDSMNEQALSLSKKDVKQTYDELMQTDYSNIYNISYEPNQNIIYIENKDTSILKSGLNITDIFKLNEKSTILVLNSSYNAFSMEKFEADTATKSKGTYIIASEGFNGYIEILAGNTPVIFYNTPEIEPLLDANTMLKIEELMKPVIVKTKNPYYGLNNNVNVPGVDDNYNGNTDINTDYTGADEDYNNDYYNQPTENTPDYSEPDDNFWGEEQIPNLPNYEDDMDIPGIEKPSNKYRPVWGTTESANHLKDNIVDGQIVLDRVYKKTLLNVIDIQGNKVNLEEKTNNTKPAELKRQEPVAVGEPIRSRDIKPFMLLGALISALSFIGFFICAQLYFKEGMRNAKLKVFNEDNTTIEITNFNDIVEEDYKENGRISVESILK